MASGELDHRVYVSGYDPAEITNDDLRRLFEKYGEVLRVDYKGTFSFVIMRNGHEEAIEALDRSEIGAARQLLEVNLAHPNTITRIREQERLERAENDPNETLFIVNYDVSTTNEDTIRALFSRFGNIRRVEMKAKFCFLVYERLDDAVRAKTEMDGYKLGDREIKIQYRAGSQGNRRFARRRSRSRSRSRSPIRRFERRSPEPNFRGRSRSPLPRRHAPFDRDRDRDRDRSPPYGAPLGHQAPPSHLRDRPRRYSPLPDRYSPLRERLRRSPPPPHYAPRRRSPSPPPAYRPRRSPPPPSYAARRSSPPPPSYSMRRSSPPPPSYSARRSSPPPPSYSQRRSPPQRSYSRRSPPPQPYGRRQPS